MNAYLRIILLILIIPLIYAHAYATEPAKDTITFNPIEHATMVINTNQGAIYLDPVGDIKLFAEYPPPDIILITDIHRDHLSADVINALKKEKTVIVGPKAAIETLTFGDVINNGESKTYGKIGIEAVPAYNLTQDRLGFHEKGRGNGYVLTIDGKRTYISGDTEDIKEMRSLKNIDYAFVCMNLPYTMTVDQAASAVLEFRPKVVIPYHYRGKEGFSDIKMFRQLVSKDSGIEVRIMDWYKK